jgi:hypothetical protein
MDASSDASGVDRLGHVRRSVADGRAGDHLGDAQDGI